ncbi:Aldose 1-epimerase [Thiorhodococcus drewsii AZ1]|uniref:Putative glucose-6-phosphate 1-epimerase n=1 Tax=Thiorhodococcus drewsii AZ1 TaxID=765913 RepID=G2E4I4_9GAMM|nr:D-hexose-6-phosphate mutarotase [Thiorhodococcus drewsii]EGV29605.1 Aldose 1-epimerase [Thiorhodococcus drewsii AZ1]
MTPEQLNAEFGIAEHLVFCDGPGGLVQARLACPWGAAVVSTYAGQVLSYVPAGEAQDLLFVSEQAAYQDGKAIKGGMPVCWPWFGPDPQGLGRPQHGFVRNRQWQVTGSDRSAGGAVRLVLAVTDTDETRQLWPSAFALRIEVTLGQALQVELITENHSDAAVEIGQALHTYFKVGDVNRARVVGLEGVTYIDKLDGGVEKVQNGTVTVSGPLDRIYLEPGQELVLEDPVFERAIRIRSNGSRSAVVWNPWVEQAAAMGDFGDLEYLQMLCVETTNAGPDRVSIAPGGAYRLGVDIRAERT